MRQAAGLLVSAFEANVGRTRLVRLKRASELTGCTILGKCEFENPGGSVKDRAALWMIRDAERQGLLVPGKPGVVVEGTAGNTGIGLALAAATRGYKCVIVITSTQSVEKLNTLRSFGAHLVEVPAVPFKDPNNYVHIARRLADALQASGQRAFYANQWDNLANRQAHVESTGPEVWQQTGGRLDAFCCAVGTGGTLSGVAASLRSLSGGRVKIALTDPTGGAMFRWFRDGELKAEGSSVTEGIGQGRVTGNIDGFRPDMQFEIPDLESLPVLYDTQQYDGLALGGSSGVNIAGAMRVAQQLGKGSTVATILCDLGSRYASKLYNPQFLSSKGLPVAPWLLDTDTERADPAFFKLVKEAHGAVVLAK